MGEKDEDGRAFSAEDSGRYSLEQSISNERE
jgi:hypothetical protein